MRILKKINIVNNIYSSNHYGDFIVEKELNSQGTSTYYQVRFLKTGTVCKAEKHNIKKGSVADCYAKTIYGVACRGQASSRHPTLNKVAFKRWTAMVSRCYNQNDIGYKSYGGKGYTVSDSWLCFENYIRDIVDIEGFNEEKYLKGIIQLDKDIKAPGNKEYSADKCIFLNASINKRNQPSKQRDFYAISPQGQQFIYNNANACAKENNLTARTILKCLKGQFSQHKGWTFKYVV